MNARAIHHQSLIKRESGEFLESLKLNAEALLKYQEENDTLGFSEVLADQTITLRHLYSKTEDQNFLLLAKHLLEAAIEIAKRNNNQQATAIPFFNLGKVNKELKAYPEAINAYREAISVQQKSPSEQHSRPAVLADFKVHLAEVEYRNGDKSAKERLIQALREIEESNEDSYNKNVWTSGANLYLVDLLKETEPLEAKQYLENAKKIIDSDNRLVLRKDQWEKLAKSIK